MLEGQLLRVEGLYIGSVADSLVKESLDQVEVSLEGFVGDKHAGRIKKADSRDRGIVRGTEIRNWRQWSGLEVSELNRIAKRLGLDYFDPSLLGPNLVFSGIENFTKLPKGTRLVFPSDVVLYIEAENLPCIGPGQELAKFYGIQPSDFPKAAIGLRGVVGTVQRAGFLRVGDLATIESTE